MSFLRYYLSLALTAMLFDRAKRFGQFWQRALCKLMNDENNTTVHKYTSFKIKGVLSSVPTHGFSSNFAYY